ncbi:MAG: DEDD exonuclease domain-containing protein [Actinomycetota bacterium]
MGIAGHTSLPSLDLEDGGKPLYDVSFCVLDLETTGGSPRDCAITEIGAVKYRGGEVTGTFQTLVNPGVGIPPFITILTGITEVMVREAPGLAAVLPTFLEFCRGAVLVGHNISFDLSFLDTASRRLGYPLAGSEPEGRRSVDTVRLARRLIRPEVRDLTLATLATHFRSPVPPIHRALDDARATAHVFHSLLEVAGTLGVTGLDDLLQLPTARGASHYSKISLADGLPRRAGVYLFLDRDGEVIYVGKADNLRTRVRSYFYGDERRRVADMLRQLHRIEHRACVNSLEAEVTELRLIHAYRPRFNQRSRPPRRELFLKLTDERYPRFSLVHKFGVNALWWLGPFRSKAAGDLVLEAVWAATPVRRCRGGTGSRTGLCAPAQLGVASCPCTGEVDAVAYRAMVDELIRWSTHAPGRLLEPLELKMRRLAADRRFEEAASMRDRHRALARALERRLAWQSLVGAGRIELEGIDGDRVLVEQGRLTGAWRFTDQPPLIGPEHHGPPDPVPPTVGTAEEAHLIWKWMTAGGVRVIDSSGPLFLPASPIPHLRAA